MPYPKDYNPYPNARTCNACKKYLPITNFYKHNDTRAPRGFYYTYTCGECSRKRCVVYGQTHKTQRNARLQKWRKDNPKLAYELDRRKHFKSVYGITVENVDKMISDQHGRCKICNRKKKLIVEHDHDKKIIRGMTCVRCNNYITFVENHPEMVMKILEYLAISKSDQKCHADIIIEKMRKMKLI